MRAGILSSMDSGELADLSNILIILTSDIDHLREAIRDVQHKFPEASITLCVQEDIAIGLEGLKGVARFITARRVGSVSFQLGKDFLKKLRKDRYDLCVLLQKEKAARVGIRAFALAHLARSKRRFAHIQGVGFISVFRSIFSSLNPVYLLKRPLVLLDKLLALMIRKSADLAVSYMLYRDRRRRSKS